MRGGPGFGRGFQEATMTRNNAPQGWEEQKPYLRQIGRAHV